MDSKIPPDPEPMTIVLHPPPEQLRRWIAQAAAENTELERWLADAADTAVARGSSR